MWRRWLILLLILVLPLPSLAGWGSRCAPAGADAPHAAHAMADAGEHAAMPCCPAAGAADACGQVDCAATAVHVALLVVRPDPGERSHVLRAAPMPGFASVTVSRHDRPPISAA